MPKPEKLNIAIDYGVTAHIGIDDDGVCILKFQDLDSGTFQVEFHETAGVLMIAQGLVAWAQWVKDQEH